MGRRNQPAPLDRADARSGGTDFDPVASRAMRVLAVCLGNICRSPAAEAAIAEAASAAGVEIEVDSAGRARQFRSADFDRFDLIVVMDRANLRDVLALAPDDAAAARVRLFRSFDAEADPSDLDVPDPYYGGSDGFRHVVDMVRRAAAGLVEDARR